VAEIVEPVQKEVYGKERVSVKVINLGSEALTEFSLAYSLNDMPPVTQLFSTNMIPYGDSVIVAFDRRADMDLSGDYDIMVYGYENEDNYLLNDTLKILIMNTETEESVTVFPNPFTDQLHIIINSKENRSVQLSLTDLSGRKVYSADQELIEGENQVILNTLYLSPAMYILNIDGSGFTQAYSLIKLKQ